MKDTKAIEVAAKLKNYFMQFIGCDPQCIFYKKGYDLKIYKVGMPWTFDVEGAQDEKINN